MSKYRGRARGRARPNEEDVVGLPAATPPLTRSSHSGEAELEALRPGMESLSLNAPPGFADVAPLPMVGRGAARSDHSSSASSSTPHPAAAQAGQATVAREAEPGPGATPKIRGAAASVGSSSGSGRGGAAGPEGRRGGVTPSVSGRSGRGSDFISDVIFGGYSKDNKKEFKVLYFFVFLCVSVNAWSLKFYFPPRFFLTNILPILVTLPELHHHRHAAGRLELCPRRRWGEVAASGHCVKFIPPRGENRRYRTCPGWV